MRKVLIALAVCLVALAAAIPALAANPGWRTFKSTSGLLCTISKPGKAESAICLATSDVLDGWMVSMGGWGIEVQNPNDRIVFKRTNSGYDSTGVNFSRADWPHQNEGVACSAGKWVASCMLRYGSLEGYAFLMINDSLEITNLDGKTVFKRGLAY